MPFTGSQARHGFALAIIGPGGRTVLLRLAENLSGDGTDPVAAERLIKSPSFAPARRDDQVVVLSLMKHALERFMA